MSLPITSFVVEHREIGLALGVVIGFLFGFVLERSGFGRAPKLAAQFYLYDMTVFKVMFGAIVTAMLGVFTLAGLGVLDLQLLSTSAASETFIWPMLFGGLLLGAGFIISGYCPGTGLVGAASGNLDAVVTILGVVVGTLLYGELAEPLNGFFIAGAKGHFFLYQWLGVSPTIVAIGVAVIAVGCFVGAEVVERIFTRKISVAASVVDESVRAAQPPRRFAFGLYGAIAVLALVTLFLPVEKAVARPVDSNAIDVEQLAQQVLDRPWELRILDLRPLAACSAQRIPGAECVPLETLATLQLDQSISTRTLVLVDDQGLAEVPAGIAGYPGKVLLLKGGHGAWASFALATPAPPGPGATPADLEAYKFRAAVNAAMTGRAAPPPPRAPTPGFVPKPKKPGGGCSS